ncbi:MAG: glycosyltransferase family 9 protein [Nitrospirae bacterium]|nr:glycosyltransferase family 9 protein [Nitrospirota bacterium]
MQTLVVKIGAIGDILMSTPALRALKKSDPGGRLTVMVGRSSRVALERNPAVDELWEIDDRILYRGGRTDRLALTLRLTLEIRRRKFDRVFVLHRDWRFNLLALLGGIHRRYGFDRGGEGLFLTGRFRPTDGAHHVRQYLGVLETAGVPSDGIHMDYHPGTPDRAEDLLTRNGVPPGRELVGIAPGGARNIREIMDTRRWPVEFYGRLVDLIVERSDSEVLVFGAESDRFLAGTFEGKPPRVHRLFGKTDLPQLATMMKQCRVVVANDSGPMHLAAAVEVPVVSLFGPTDPREKFPLNDGSIHLWKPEGLACCPCYRDGRFPACPIDVACLRRITPEEVWEKVRGFLLAPGNRQEGGRRLPV